MKIDIIGSVASGKTTLAKRISKKYGVSYYEKDNIVWKRTANGDVKRSPEERDKYFYDKWVFEFNRMKKRLLKELSMYGGKVKIFKHSKDAYAFVMKSYPQD